MKKRLFSLVLTAILCCSAIFVLAACGEAPKLTCNTGMTEDTAWNYQQKTSEEWDNMTDKEREDFIVLGSAGAEFTLGDETGMSLADMLAKNGVLSGFSPTTKGTHSMRVSYGGQSCVIYYKVA